MDALGEFLSIWFVPHIVYLGGTVIAAILMLLLIIMFTGFLPPEE